MVERKGRDNLSVGVRYPSGKSELPMKSGLHTVENFPTVILRNDVLLGFIIK